MCGSQERSQARDVYRRTRLKCSPLLDACAHCKPARSQVSGLTHAAQLRPYNVSVQNMPEAAGSRRLPLPANEVLQRLAHPLWIIHSRRDLLHTQGFPECCTKGFPEFSAGTARVQVVHSRGRACARRRAVMHRWDCMKGN